jgi:tetratricopeptide (TPR) repeat protein
MRRKTQKQRGDASLDKVFLDDLPWEIGRLLSWYEAGARSEECGAALEEFACSFLGALAQDQALIPRMNVQPAKLLAWVLTHHLRNPENCGAWLNLGWALRIMATSDPKPIAATRLERALKSFDRSLALGQGERALKIRALAGKAFACAQLGRFKEGVRFSLTALELDRSDPNLWLLHSSLLGMAGRQEEALELIDGAYRAYVMAGRPEGLRSLVDSVIPPVNAPDPAKHLRRMQ